MQTPPAKLAPPKRMIVLMQQENGGTRVALLDHAELNCQPLAGLIEESAIIEVKHKELRLRS